ncbi:hypothetical protein [Nostoc sp.]|uniref:hypothetical protein n=1 Tax=Nostoc sp. TaxID=1180 RepID=UPI002FF4CA2E
MPNITANHFSNNLLHRFSVGVARRRHRALRCSDRTYLNLVSSYLCILAINFWHCLQSCNHGNAYDGNRALSYHLPTAHCALRFVKKCWLYAFVDLAFAFADLAFAFADLAFAFADLAFAFADLAFAFADLAFAFADLAFAFADLAIAFADLAIAFVDLAIAFVDLAIAFADLAWI